ncbi:MAG: thrombospondin type 3 repeat-containing protein [Pseudomonadota bacterium]
MLKKLFILFLLLLAFSLVASSFTSCAKSTARDQVPGGDGDGDGDGGDGDGDGDGDTDPPDEVYTQCVIECSTEYDPILDKEDYLACATTCEEAMDNIDTDGDTINDVDDNCPNTANEDQLDEDENGVGDVCEEDDDDLDNIENSIDNCRYIPNEDQADADIDGLGDACEDCPDALSESECCGTITYRLYEANAIDGEEYYETMFFECETNLTEDITLDLEDMIIEVQGEFSGDTFYDGLGTFLESEMYIDATENDDKLITGLEIAATSDAGCDNCDDVQCVKVLYKILYPSGELGETLTAEVGFTGDGKVWEGCIGDEPDTMIDVSDSPSAVLTGLGLSGEDCNLEGTFYTRKIKDEWNSLGSTSYGWLETEKSEADKTKEAGTDAGSADVTFSLSDLDNCDDNECVMVGIGFFGTGDGRDCAIHTYGKYQNLLPRPTVESLTYNAEEDTAESTEE